MDHRFVDYASPEYPAARSWLRRALFVLALAAPLVTAPAFVLGTIILQDALVNGDGRSWERAALRMAVPTGLVSAVALAGSIGLLPGAKRPRPALAVVAATLNAMVLTLIVFGVLVAGLN